MLRIIVFLFLSLIMVEFWLGRTFVNLRLVYLFLMYFNIVNSFILFCNFSHG